MADLDRGQRALAADKVVDAPVLRNMCVPINAGAVIRLAAALFDRRFLAEHDAGASHRKLAEVDKMVIGRASVFRRVLAHRRNHDAVAGGHRAQCDRGKQQGQLRGGSHGEGFRENRLSEILNQFGGPSLVKSSPCTPQE